MILIPIWVFIAENFFIVLCGMFLGYTLYPHVIKIIFRIIKRRKK